VDIHTWNLNVRSMNDALSEQFNMEDGNKKNKTLERYIRICI